MENKSWSFMSFASIKSLLTSFSATTESAVGKCSLSSRSINLPRREETITHEQCSKIPFKFITTSSTLLYGLSTRGTFLFLSPKTCHFYLSIVIPNKTLNSFIYALSFLSLKIRFSWRLLLHFPLCHFRLSSVVFIIFCFRLV